MVKSIGAYVSEGTLREAAIESNLQGASKSQILRFALLRTVMSAREARNTIFGEPEDLHETAGRVDAKIPDHELALVQNKYPDIPISDLARFGFALSAGEPHERAWETASVKRGRKPRKEMA
jgi:hypothetical protein